MSERDLSKARIKPGYVLDPGDISEPRMSGQDWKDFSAGVRLFNNGEYWESHEAWEYVWKRHDEPSRVFFQALIQLAAAYHQLDREIHHGVIKHFRSASTKLAPFPDVFLGVDLTSIKRCLEKGTVEAERLGPEELKDFNRNLVAKIDFEAPERA
jgi:hypothetical protein